MGQSTIGMLSLKNVIFNISKENFQKIFPIPCPFHFLYTNSKKLITKQQNEVKFW